MTWEQFIAMSDEDQENYRRSRARRYRSLRDMRLMIDAIRLTVTLQSETKGQ